MIDFENDWSGECRIDPIGGNHMILREISGSLEDGYAVRINDVMACSVRLG